MELLKITVFQGAQGKVYKGTWEQEDVAIKVLLTQNVDPELINRELRILDQVNHLNIIKFFGFCLQPKKLMILMEYFPYNNLYEIIFDDDVQEEFTLNLMTQKSIVLQLCDAVNHLHSRKHPIIHRDIKPSNILLSNQLLLKLCDFGLSTAAGSNSKIRTSKGHVSTKGSPCYLAPEVLIKKESATVKSDVWACACVIFELYSKTEIWNDYCNTTDFKEYIASVKIPNLSKVPVNVRETLKACFVDVDQRPLITELMALLEKF